MIKSLIALAECALILSAATAKNYIATGDPDIDQWYARAMRSDIGTLQTPASCCGIADAFWADGPVEVTKIDGKVEVRVTLTDERSIPGRAHIPPGTKVLIPPQVMDKWHQGNPTGHRVVFIVGMSTIALCYFDDTGI
jgi:hypothetical protein